MHYANMRCRHVMLGDIVRTSFHKDAMHYMVKKIDTLSGEIYIVPMDSSYCGEWHSAGCVHLVV